MYYPREVLDEVRMGNDIVDVIGSFVHLKRSGSSYVGLCPFHKEKTPSFNVNRENQFYHCFGCGASGNVYSFLMQHQNYSFQDAVKYLAEDVYKRQDDKCIHSCKLLNKSVMYILSLQRLFNVVFEVFIDGEAFADCRYVENPIAFGSSQKAVNYIKNTRKPIDNMNDFIISNADRLDSIDIVVSKPDERKYVADYIKNIDNDIYVTSSVPVSYTHLDVYKRQALSSCRPHPQHRHTCLNCNFPTLRSIPHL